MKLALASDLHLEFADIILKNEENAEVLILSGDICIAEELYDSNGEHQRYRDFFSRCSDEFPHVIYIAGNHEFYHGKWVKNLQVLRDECSRYPNVYFMENDIKTISDTTFIGCTLWTDMNKGDPLTAHAISDMMNDYRVIRHDELGYTKLRPAHTVSRFRKSVQYIRTMIEGKFEEKFVVVGHHSPSTQSIHEKYIKDTIMNGAYASDLSEFILDNPQIKLWTHGHTHYPFDYMIGDTRIVCNPRGYVGYEKDADNFKLKYLEV
jgi:predicted phosphodiesterase